MEETLGRRIVARRKKLGMTQDALAEKLGVTAQAVSKWENDQSCPDITMLPKLAEVFDCTTDELLGREAKLPREEEPLQEAPEEKPEGIRMESKNGLWELEWDGGRRGGLGIAVWLLLTGGLAMASAILNWGVDTWHILWSSGLMVFGFFGLLRNFSVLHLGTFLFGGYFLLWHLRALPPALTVLQWEVVIPGTLLILGLCILLDSLRKPKKSRIHISRNGRPLTRSYCIYDGEAFDCATSFGENHYLITLPRLSGGCADLSFGELEVDLRSCGEIAEGCTLELNCSFGALELLVPRSIRAEPNIRTAFASFETKGEPLSNASSVIYVNGSANFGEITLRYF